MTEIPSITQLSDQSLAAIEVEVGQSAPIAKRATFRVLARMIGMLLSQLYRYATAKANANSTLKAQGKDLEDQGVEYGVIRKGAARASFTFLFDGNENETVWPDTIAVGHTFFNPETDLRYRNTSEIICNLTSGWLLSTEMVAVGDGSLYDISPGTTLMRAPEDSMFPPGSPEADAWWPTVHDGTGTVDEGGSSVPEEGIEDFRARLLRVKRAKLGGYGLGDLRKFVEAVPGVVRAWPYTGYIDPEAEEPLYGSPGQVTVFWECDESSTPSAVAPYVYDALRWDPITGEQRYPATVPSSEIYHQVAEEFHVIVSIYGSESRLPTFPDIEDEFKAKIEARLTERIKDFSPWIEGLDPDTEILSTLYPSDIIALTADICVEYNSTIGDIYLRYVNSIGGEVSAEVIEVPVGRYAVLQEVRWVLV